MSVGAQTKASGSPAAGEADGGGQGPDPDNAAGMRFARLTVLPTLLVMAWLVVGLPLLLLGWFSPQLMLALAVPIMALFGYLGFRLLPSRWPGAWPAGSQRPGQTPWWAVIGVLAVAVAFGVDQIVHQSQFVIVTRDPASYMQFAAWISGHHSLPIPQDNAAFGGLSPYISFVSPAFYQVELHIVPQFMAGLPMALSAGFWLGGVSAAAAMAPIIGACMVLTFGGLVARLVGVRWAPLAALVLALALPMEFTSRSTYSEPLAGILFLGGLCLVVDSLATDGAAARVLAGLAGLALSLTFVVRLDGASDILPVIAYCGLLVIGRRKQALPMIVGFLLGIVYGILDGTMLTLPYLQANKTSVIPLAIILGALIIATIITTIVFRLIARRRKRMPQLRWRWLPNAGAVLVVLVSVGFFVRPYVNVARANSASAFQATIVGYQLSLGQPIDPSRTYYELSLRWVFWYVGVPVVIFATAGAAILIRRALRGGIPAWTLPLLVFSWAIVSTLYRPAITPDQPWASRRLVAAVLPGFILLAVWAVSWFSGWLRARGTGQLARGVALACCGIALLLPAAITTFNISVHTGGRAGVGLSAGGWGTKSTYTGEIAAVNALCAALPPNSTVLLLNSGLNKVGNQFPQVVRGMCGRPAASMAAGDPAQVQQVIASIRQAGRQPVLLAGSEKDLKSYGGSPRHVVSLRTDADAATLISPPTDIRAFGINVWITVLPR